MRLPRLLSAACAAVFIAACGNESMIDAPAAPSTEGSAAQELTAQGQLDPLFEKAGREFNVPASLLKAISFSETRFQMVQGREEFAGMPAAHGLMALRGDRLERGAALAGVTAQAASTDPLANLRAAAALLSADAAELKIDRADLGAWAPVVARYSGIKDFAGQAQYVHQDVYGTLRRGVVAESAHGGALATLMPQQVSPRFAAAPVTSFAGASDYGSAIWRPSPNFNSRPTGAIGQIGMIIIHDCEGSYSSCWSWLDNSAAQASAHYVVKEDGTEISQLVLEANRAWHVAATYDCTLNSSVECWRNGYSVNHFSVGIEHGGFASQTSWPVSQIDASAKLSCDITLRNNIIRDHYHILGHGQLQPADRTDPGPNWPWTDYLNRINSYCSSSQIIVDSNNANNNTAVGYISVSANWTSSTNVAGYWGTGYFYAQTQAISDAAAFYFYLPAAATKTIDAWWTAGTDRSTTAPWVIVNASGTNLATVSTNQQVNGSQWNTLGTWSFPAGWNKVLLSRWTTAGSVVIADAVRIR